MSVKKNHWNARYYEKNKEIQFSHARNVLAKIEIKQTDHVLDIGCGDGELTAHIANFTPLGSVLGIDSSKEMVALAKQRYSSQNKRNLSYQVEHAEAHQGKEPYNLIVSFSCLHWLKDLPRTISRYIPQLSSGGRFVALLFEQPYPLWDTLQGLMETSGWRSIFKGYKPPYIYHGEYQLVDMLKGISIEMTDIDVQSELCTYNYPTTTRYIQHITGWLPHVSQLPPQTKPRFIRDLVETYEQVKETNSQGDLVYSFKRHIISFFKK